MSKYGTTVKRLNESSDDGAQVENYRPCSVCKTSTLSATLSQYGARCFACYERYLTEGAKSDTADKRRDGPKAWAWHLRARELAGARLSRVQRDMWRAALAYELAAMEREVVDV